MTTVEYCEDPANITKWQCLSEDSTCRVEFPSEHCRILECSKLRPLIECDFCDYTVNEEDSHKCMLDSRCWNYSSAYANQCRAAYCSENPCNDGTYDTIFCANPDNFFKWQCSDAVFAMECRIENPTNQFCFDLNNTPCDSGNLETMPITCRNPNPECRKTYPSPGQKCFDEINEHCKGTEPKFHCNYARDPRCQSAAGDPWCYYMLENPCHPDNLQQPPQCTSPYPSCHQNYPSHSCWVQLNLPCEDPIVSNRPIQCLNQKPKCQVNYPDQSCFNELNVPCYETAPKKPKQCKLKDESCHVMKPPPECRIYGDYWWIIIVIIIVIVIIIFGVVYGIRKRKNNRVK